VLDALGKERIDALTKESLVKALADDGIHDLEGAAAHIVARIKKDRELQKHEPSLIDYTLLGRPTTPEVARGIVHTVPEVPFILDGVTYDPKDIGRFDGKALVFMPIVGSDGNTALQTFHEDVSPILAGYFQLRQVALLLNLADFAIPGLPPQSPPGTPPGTSHDPNDPGPWGCGGTTGVPCGRPDPPSKPTQPAPKPAPTEPSFPVTGDQIQMFDGGDYTGNWFWLAKGFMWGDLTQVSRGGWFGGDWNDAIFSLSSTSTFCIYCEHIHLQGSKFFPGPGKPIRNLAALGWHNRISSVWNYA
jgi:hypothetical protein